jgi:peptide/nickel transport system substrate-binding protein
MFKKLFNLLLVASMLIVFAPAVTAAPPAQGAGQDYVVVKDDSLSKLADKYLGNLLAYSAIMALTNDKAAKDSSYAKIADANQIEVGWKIYIPSAEEAKAFMGSGAAPAAAMAAPTKFKEAPMLAQLVAAGKLPSVDKRLPEKPPVIETVEGIGQYGGVWRRGFLGPSDYNGYVRIVDDALVRFTPDGSKVEPKLIEGWESSPDFTTWTVNMLKGAKWSDGTPFTADDIMFWYNDVLLNKDLTPAIPAWMKNKDGSTVTVKKVDDYTVQWIYKAPNTTFLYELANKDNGDKAYPVFLPAAYMKQFHASYADKVALDKLVADAKFKTWTELFALKKNQAENPDRPGMAAWIPTTRASDQVLVLKRNPYYVAVDKEGNQLPYIDEVDMKFFADAQALNLAAIAGQFDEQERHINVMNYPVLKENESKGGYHIITWPAFGGADADISFNQTYTKDQDLAILMQNKNFRIAMSYAINRSQIQETAFLGLGEPRQPVPAPGHPFYPGDEWAKKYTAYDPAQANQLLDSIGLTKKDADGFRMYPGKDRTVQIEISVVPAFGPWPDVAQMVAKDWQAVGIKAVVQVRERALHFQLRASNDLQTEIWNQDTAGFPFTGAPKMDPRTTLASGITVWPAYKQWYDTGGKEGQAPSDDAKKIVELIDKAKTVGGAEQAAIAQDIFKLWVDNCYEIGTVGLTPMDQGVVVVSDKMHNIPNTLAKDWPLRTPGNARTEQFWLSQ